MKVDQYALIYNLLLQADVEIIYNLSQINKDSYNISHNEQFWKEKMSQDFGYVPTKVNTELEIVDPDYRYNKSLYCELLKAHKMANIVLMINEHECTRLTNRSKGIIAINIEYITDNILSIRDLVKPIFDNFKSQTDDPENDYTESSITLTYMNHNRYNIGYEAYDYDCYDYDADMEIDLNLTRIILTKIVHDMNTEDKCSDITCLDNIGNTFIFKDFDYYEEGSNYLYYIRRGMWEVMNKQFV